MRQKECIVSEYTGHQVKERKDLKISGRIAANSENESLWADMSSFNVQSAAGYCYGLCFIKSDVIEPRFLVGFLRQGLRLASNSV